MTTEKNIGINCIIELYGFKLSIVYQILILFYIRLMSYELS